MWKLKESANGKTKKENALLLKEKLENLVGEIAELRSLEVGINAIDSEASYDLVLSTTFDNEEDLKSYANNPKHVLVSEFCGSIRESRVVVDYLV